MNALEPARIAIETSATPMARRPWRIGCLEARSGSSTNSVLAVATRIATTTAAASISGEGSVAGSARSPAAASSGQCHR